MAALLAAAPGRLTAVTLLMNASRGTPSQAYRTAQFGFTIDPGAVVVRDVATSIEDLCTALNAHLQMSRHAAATTGWGVAALWMSLTWQRADVASLRHAVRPWLPKEVAVAAAHAGHPV